MESLSYFFHKNLLFLNGNNKENNTPLFIRVFILAILIFIAWIILPSIITDTLSDYVKEKLGGTYSLTIECEKT